MSALSKNIIPRVAAINDLSGFGRVSLTEAVPILSAMGIEVCPLPTAVLSTHTYKFKDYTFLDMTEEMPKIAAHWKSLDLKFDAICSGYLGSRRQIDIISDFIDNFGSDALVVIDPVLGDNELHDAVNLYSKRMQEIVSGMRTLVSRADVITPNLTEACLLLNEDYPNKPIDSRTLCRYLKRLSSLGADMVAITSVMTSENEMSVGVYDKASDKYYKIDCGYIARPFHGTGDIFTAVLTGALLKGESFVNASNTAVAFIRRAIGFTLSKGNFPIERGVIFEPVLADFFSRENNEIYYKEITL